MNLQKALKHQKLYQTSQSYNPALSEILIVPRNPEDRIKYLSQHTYADLDLKIALQYSSDQTYTIVEMFRPSFVQN